MAQTQDAAILVEETFISARVSEAQSTVAQHSALAWNFMEGKQAVQEAVRHFWTDRNKAGATGDCGKVHSKGQAFCDSLSPKPHVLVTP